MSILQKYKVKVSCMEREIYNILKI